MAIRIFKLMEIMLISKDMFSMVFFFKFDVARVSLEIGSVKAQQDGRTARVISHNRRTVYNCV